MKKVIGCLPQCLVIKVANRPKAPTKELHWPYPTWT